MADQKETVVVASAAASVIDVKTTAPTPDATSCNTAYCPGQATKGTEWCQSCWDKWNNCWACHRYTANKSKGLCQDCYREFYGGECAGCGQKTMRAYIWHHGKRYCSVVCWNKPVEQDVYQHVACTRCHKRQRAAFPIKYEYWFDAAHKTRLCSLVCYRNQVNTHAGIIDDAYYGRDA